MNIQMAKKSPEMDVKQPFMSQFHFESEYRYDLRAVSFLTKEKHLTMFSVLIELSDATNN